MRDYILAAVLCVLSLAFVTWPERPARPKAARARGATCPRCRRWSPLAQYRTVDTVTGQPVRAVLCACGRTFDRDARLLPIVRDAGPTYGPPPIPPTRETRMGRGVAEAPGGPYVMLGAEPDPYRDGCWLIPQGRHTPPLRVDSSGRPTIGQPYYL